MLQLQWHRMRRYRRSQLPNVVSRWHEAQGQMLIAEGKKCEFFRRTVLCEDCCQNPISVAAENLGLYSNEATASNPLSQEDWLRAREERLKAGDGGARKKGHRYCKACRTKRAHWAHYKKMTSYMKRYRRAKLQPVVPFCEIWPL